MGSERKRSSGQIREELTEARRQRTLRGVILSVAGLVFLVIDFWLYASIGLYALILGLGALFGGLVIIAIRGNRVKALIKDLGEAEEAERTERGNK